MNYNKYQHKQIYNQFKKHSKQFYIQNTKQNFKQFKIIRPLLNYTRKEITNLCKIFYLPIYKDKTNYNIYYTRNRIRNKLIPYIKKYINPKIENNIFNLTQKLEFFTKYFY